MKRRKWSFAAVRRRAVETHRKDFSLPAFLRPFWEKVNRPDITPQEVAGAGTDWLLPIRRVEALILSDGEIEEAWKRIHLILRYQAFSWAVYLQRARELAKGAAPGSKPRRLGIGIIDLHLLTEISFVMALAACLHEDEIADWFGWRCLEMLGGKEAHVAEDALVAGPVAPFLLQLYCRWRGAPAPWEGVRPAPDLRYYGAVFSNWGSPDSLVEDCARLCDLHLEKAIRWREPNLDGIVGLAGELVSEFPIEIHFLQRVRADLGLPVPNPAHVLLQTPFSAIPAPVPHVAYDEHIEGMYRRCKELMPELSIPWEDRFLQAAGSEGLASLPFLPN